MRNPHIYSTKYGIDKLCKYTPEDRGYITTTPAQCKPIRQKIENLIDSCSAKKQKCENTLACLTDAGYPGGLPKFLRPLDIKFFKRELAPVPMCCARSFKAVGKNVMNIKYFVKVFNYQTHSELKSELSNSQTSVSFQKYMLEIHKERENELKEQLKNMPKLTKEDEYFYSHMSLNMQKILGKKIEEMVENMEYTSSENGKSSRNITRT